jgi:uncharacterized metal-binding protein YceD (DUF177 family)
MDDTLKIYVDHLKQGKVEKIDQILSPKFLEVEDPELTFESDVTIHGEVYITDDELIIHLDISTVGLIPCSICNEPVTIPILLKGFYHIESLDNIRAGIFDAGEVIRESILLEAPAFAECQGGNCPQRKTLGKYFKKKDPSQDLETEDDGYQPFSNL